MNTTLHVPIKDARDIVEEFFHWAGGEDIGRREAPCIHRLIQAICARGYVHRGEGIFVEGR